ncbi:MAG: hypothetical protein M0P31_10935 [Solirubrobacteraceae bacterium]|nr:hypothetical protein [Solirubrobacteraceae bacterium]
MATTDARTVTDAIIPVEDWISEHFFTTDAKKESFLARVLERRKAWDAEKDRGTTRTRWTAARRELASRFARLTSDTDPAEVGALHDDLATILGFAGTGGYTRDRRGPVTFLHSAGLPEPLIALVEARPVAAVEELVAKDAQTLLEPFAVDETTELTSVARLLSTLFVRDDARPAFVLVFAGSRLLLAERERWPEGRYLTVDLQLVLDRADDKKGGEVDRALTCVDAESLAPDAEGAIWWHGVLEASVKHTVGVSQDLRDGVRLSIEIIGNEVVRRRRAQGLSPLPADEAQPLAKQALRFLYRILFLLYAEASPELGVLPTGAPEYERGYSLDRLRDLTLVELSTPQAREGTHLYDSLAVLFRMVDEGHEPAQGTDTDAAQGEHLTFRSLRADLFRPEATAHIAAVGLGNAAMQQVLEHLLLSKASGKRDRGFISYAELGINQLGAVYEGLMSYTGTFAQEDLYEVAKNGNPEKGSWVVPIDRAEGLSASDFVRVTDDVTGEERPVVHERGSFVFRLAGRERQQSASYYTPEVLTRFVVSQALEELLDQDNHTTTAEEVLQLTVCEPALGSGAFAIEAVRQLAEQYLRRRQEETGATIDPDDYPRELQKVKAYLALHQTYGVDLNATAVELAEISLWLDTMVEGLQAPWFGLHLRRGNSLIGARKAVYARGDVTSKDWLTTPPTPVGPGDDDAPEIAGRIPHFLLPAQGWGAAADVGKEIKDLAPDAVQALKDWRKQFRKKPTKKQLDRLVALGHRVERLWAIATRRLEIAEAQTRRDIPLWGREADDAALTVEGRPVTREEIEANLADPDGAYQRLRRVMDAWCALWFWPLTVEQAEPPELEAWIDALEMLLGVHSEKGARPGQIGMGEATTWDELEGAEARDLQFSTARSTADTRAEHPWLGICAEVAERQGFFHWHLDFAPVFARRGGFDLQVGNPPWVRPRTDVEGLLAEGDPWWQLAVKPTQEQKQQRRAMTLELPVSSAGGDEQTIRDLAVDASVDIVVAAEVLGAVTEYPLLAGLQPNLYRCFMAAAWGHQAPSGVSVLIHPETHFTDANAGVFRAATYRRLRRHWQFINELQLFEIQHQKTYGVHVYGAMRSEPAFAMATSLYHPDTVLRSLAHDGSGEEPGIKDPDGYWDLRPHGDRILTVDRAMLTTWHDLLEDETVPVEQTRMVYTVNRTSARVLAHLATQPRIRDLGLEFSRGWDESIDRKKGFFDVEWGRPASWDDVILQGPHLFVGNPFYKSPNPAMQHHLDWSPVDLETLEPDAIPVTSYKPRGDRAKYDKSYTQWSGGSARDFYRVAWRRMAANTGERTLIPALIPDRTAHINAVYVAGSSDARMVAAVSGVMASLISDFLVRVVPMGDILPSAVGRLAKPRLGAAVEGALARRALRLGCMSDAYARLWREAGPFEDTMGDAWTGGLDYPGRTPLAQVGSAWSSQTPLRRASDRRQALLEIDALVALALGVSIDDLCTIYRTQFPVLYGYDRHRDHYDANGRLVPQDVLKVWRTKGERISEDERTHTNAAGNTYVYELPFVTLDREADMRQAYADFERVLQERDGG